MQAPRGSNRLYSRRSSWALPPRRGGMRRVVTLAACARQLRVSVSPWQKPWVRRQRDREESRHKLTAGERQRRAAVGQHVRARWGREERPDRPNQIVIGEIVRRLHQKLG